MVQLADPAWQIGAFAFEVDFIDSVELGKAVSIWADHPEKTLLEVLVQQQFLLEEDVPLLRALWIRHQSRCGQSSDTDQRRSSDTNRSAMDELESTGHEFKSRFSGIIQPQFSENRFQIIQPIASGGLGQVSLAHDSQLNRKVALKEILPRFHDDPSSYRRFMREAEITGELEHPAIVPIYAVGFRENGSPYYAMRLILGRNFRQIVEDHHRESSELDCFSSLEFRRILGSYVEVCHAIAFAHSKQVVHRDIKPSNIIVGENGETMVVDWGMAKRLDSNASANEETISNGSLNERTLNGVEEELTSEGLVLGTPAYMSPEQALGQLDNVGPASDLFSLGATLYFALTGTAPYSGNSQQAIVAMAIVGNFIPPRTLKLNIPRPLEAICVKAMAIEQTARYATVNHLIEDLERWLADESVSVLSESFSQRIWRIMRRNKVLSQVVATAVAIVAVTAVVFSLLLNHQSNLAKAEKQTAVKLADEKSRLAEEKTELADKVRTSLLEANTQNKISLSTLRTVVWNIQRKLKPIDAAQGVRRELLDQALQGLAKVAKSLETREDADRATILAHNELGMIYLTVGNGDGKNAMEQAIVHFELARDLGRRVAAEHPDQIQPQRDISIALEHLGDAQFELGNYEFAEQAYSDSLAISVAAEKEHLGNATLIRDIAFGWEKIGNIQLKHGKVAPAREAYVESQKAFQSLLATDPNNPDFMRDCKVALSKMGNIYGQEFKWEMAAQAFRDCLRISEKEVGEGSKAIQSRDSSVLYNKLGSALQQLERLDEAGNAFDAGLNIAGGILEAAPNSTTAQRDMSVSLLLVADLAMVQKNFEAVPALYDRCLQIRKGLAESDPQNFSIQIDLATVLLKYGKFQEAREDRPNAISYFNESHRILQSLNQSSIEASPEHRILLGEVNAAMIRLTTVQ